MFYAYTSTSTDESVASGFGQYFLTISAHAGKSIDSFSIFPGEDEVQLGRNRIIQINKYQCPGPHGQICDFDMTSIVQNYCR